MSRVLATYNIKGGVGKTSAAVNLSYLASLEGLRTLLWDLDPQGGSTYLFRVKPKVRGGGDKTLRRAAEHVEDGLPPFGIAARGDDAARLVEDDRPPAAAPHVDAVDRDRRPFGDDG